MIDINSISHFILNWIESSHAHSLHGIIDIWKFSWTTQGLKKTIPKNTPQTKLCLSCCAASVICSNNKLKHTFKFLNLLMQFSLCLKIMSPVVHKVYKVWQCAKSFSVVWAIVQICFRLVRPTQTRSPARIWC